MLPGFACYFKEIRLGLQTSFGYLKHAGPAVVLAGRSLVDAIFLFFVFLVSVLAMLLAVLLAPVAVPIVSWFIERNKK